MTCCSSIPLFTPLSKHPPLPAYTYCTHSPPLCTPSPYPIVGNREQFTTHHSSQGCKHPSMQWWRNQLITKRSPPTLLLPNKRYMPLSPPSPHHIPSFQPSPPPTCENLRAMTRNISSNACRPPPPPHAWAAGAAYYQTLTTYPPPPKQMFFTTISLSVSLMPLPSWFSSCNTHFPLLSLPPNQALPPPVGISKQ